MQTSDFRSAARSASAALASIAFLIGCDGGAKPQQPAGKAAAQDHGHDHAAGADHSHDAQAPAAAEADHGHGHGATTQLGEQEVAGFTVRASRDGAIASVPDAPIDVWITGGSGRVTAVRFWIGTQDAKGSVKAKAEIEKDNWHTHAELPSPMPAGSKLWVEFEVEGSAKQLVGFDLKT
jgi:hypothetical protein